MVRLFLETGPGFRPFAKAQVNESQVLQSLAALRFGAIDGIQVARHLEVLDAFFHWQRSLYSNPRLL